MTGLTTHDRAETGAGRRAEPLIVTEDAELLDDLLRLCAAAGAQAEVHHGPPERRAVWDAAPLVLVGDDAAARCRGAARRRGVLLVGRDQDDPDVWRRAVEIGADSVLRLPDAESWLVDRIADVVEGVGRQALTVGVIGGRGGAGASTLACALAVAAARGGRRTMLVDGDPLGGGLDVLLGGERERGLRWPDFAASQGRVAGAALEESLPSLHGLRLLSWDRGETVAVPPEAMRSVLAAARRCGGVVVVDLPRRVDDATVEALAQLDMGLLVVPGELRAVAAARRVAAMAGMVLDDLRLVVRGPYAAGVDEAWIARVLDLPLAGEVPVEPRLLASLDGGAPPGASASGPLGRFCAAFWDRALAAEARP
ncbi:MULTISPECIES: septum site-determining protein Ssd [Streptomyces]|uniref:Septum formation initiator n=2 Tax=Streptomyces TaxID=1883 RepID=A0A100Y8X2_9ACTN|nr:MULTISPECIES: septum site-determining protein Ssd [Streptomyces]KUH39872.1 septum formation initiator [Streptomyces kanasensis]UUS32227.1 septum formation initiator [Streptomyces changanensis]